VSATTGVTLASLPAGRLHDVLAQAGPGPAGGSAAALAATMASGLVRLVARVSQDWEEAPGIAAQAAALGDRALVLADDDHRAYAHALEQLRSPAFSRSRTRQEPNPAAGSPPAAGQVPDDGGAAAERDAALGRALRRAAEVPLAIAETAADVAALAALAARDGAASVRGDAWAAATLAEAAGVAAARLVHVNLATRPDGELSTRADLAARSATAAREVALSCT
jgi:formiminotetrahydrofolate cyclodeaminase